eukprot:362009-Chlamydomonas_euryale.AAC.5
MLELLYGDLPSPSVCKAFQVLKSCTMHASLGYDAVLTGACTFSTGYTGTSLRRTTSNGLVSALMSAVQLWGARS